MGPRNSCRAREHMLAANEQNPFVGRQRCCGAEAGERGAVERNGHGDSAYDLALGQHAHRPSERRPRGRRDALGPWHGNRAGNGSRQALQCLRVPLRERALKPWLRRQRRCALLRPDGLVRGFAQRRLERAETLEAGAG